MKSIEEIARRHADEIAEDADELESYTVRFTAAIHEALGERERAAWEAGFKLAVSYGDNSIHFDGAQKERQWAAYKAEALGRQG